MDVVIMLVFISLILVSMGLIFFISRLRDGDFEHAERLSLLPLAEDEGRPRATGEMDAGAGEMDEALQSQEGGCIDGRR